jgi:Tol biopolymer transport system component
MKNRIVISLAVVVIAVILAGCSGLDFSPDGKRIAFAWYQYDSRVIAVVQTDGRGFRVIPYSTRGWSPRWSPDGRYILFCREPQNTSTQLDKFSLWLHDNEEHRTSMLTERAAVIYAWSPDSRQVIACHPSDDLKPSEVVLYDAETKQVLRSHSFEQKEAEVYEFVWVPKMEPIAMLVYEDSGKMDVYLLRDGAIQRLTTTQDVLALNFSPRDNRLIWARMGYHPSRVHFTLHAYDLQTGKAIRLPFHENLPKIQPEPGYVIEEVNSVQILPDGKHLLFWLHFEEKSHPKHKDRKLYTAVYRARMDGTGLKQIKQYPPETGGGWYEKRKLLPIYCAWSRDGRYFAELLGEEKRLELRLMDLETGQTKQLLHKPLK